MQHIIDAESVLSGYSPAAEMLQPLEHNLDEELVPDVTQSVSVHYWALPATAVPCATQSTSSLPLEHNMDTELMRERDVCTSELLETHTTPSTSTLSHIQEFEQNADAEVVETTSLVVQDQSPRPIIMPSISPIPDQLPLQYLTESVPEIPSYSPPVHGPLLPSNVTFASLMPVPHHNRPVTTRPRKKHPSYEITSPECITFVEERSKKQVKKKKVKGKKVEEQCEDNGGRQTGTRKKKTSIKPTAAKKSVIKQRVSGSKASEGVKPVLSEPDNTHCLYCEIVYSESTVAWVRCKVCHQWACEQCAHLGRKKVFICDGCKCS